MKKITILSLLLTTVFVLSACWNSNQQNSTNSGNLELPKQEKQAQINVPEKYCMDITTYIKEKWQQDQQGKYRICKNWKDQYFEFLTAPIWSNPNAKMKIIANLIKDWKSYSKMEINWKTFRFDQWNVWNFWNIDNNMFIDMEKIQKEIEQNWYIKKDKETINWQKLLCYYTKQWEKTNQKTCFDTNKKYLAYYEINNYWKKTIFEVNNYTKNVDQKYFETPTDAKDMSEMWKIMMWQ